MSKNDGDPRHTQLVETYTVRIMFCPSTNALEVNGPLDNAILYLGMLEMAKLTLLEHRARRAAQNIVEAPPGLRL